MEEGLAMRSIATVLAGVGLVLFAVSPAGAGDDGYCPNAQSPRDLDRSVQPSLYALAGPSSFLTQTSDQEVTYAPRVGGPPMVLHRCGQHYHFPIENPQGCKGETEAKGGEAKGPPPPGSWVEVHTVFAAVVRTGQCDPETLDCCEKGPFVVRAFTARVTAGGKPAPIEPPPGRPLAEWSGSTTGPDRTPDECKPAALWSFRLGCDFTVSEGQLGRFHHVDPARPVQTGNRLSRDLTMIGP
jgi:hypothetical protein